MTIYDEVFYEDEPFSNTHPQTMAAIGKLYGMNPAPAESCRFLELGAAKGNNIIGMAYGLPKSKFVGIDLSIKQVEMGNAFIKKIGLLNVELRQANILELNEDLGTFDYIIAHGVLSWVPVNVRDKLFELCSKLLSKDGICYFSYNTYPGWKARDIFRDIMSFEAKEARNSGELVNSSRKALAYTKALLTDNHSDMSKHLKEELKFYQNRPDWYFLHDFMAENNQPFYINDIFEKASMHKLQYLADTELSMCTSVNLAEEAQNVLKTFSDNLLAFEQYSDIARVRSFRRSLFCRENVKLSRNSFEENILEIFVAGNLKEHKASVESKDGLTRFLHINGGSIVVPDLCVKHAIRSIIENWPKAISVKELLINLNTLSFTKEEIIRARDVILKAIFANILEVRSFAGVSGRQLVEKPISSFLARSQAKVGSQVTSLIHHPVHLDEIEREVLIALDGSKTCLELEDFLKSKYNKAENITEQILQKFLREGLLH